MEKTEKNGLLSEIQSMYEPGRRKDSYYGCVGISCDVKERTQVPTLLISITVITLHFCLYLF